MILRKDIILDSNPLLREKSVDVPLPLSKEDEKLLQIANTLESNMNYKNQIAGGEK